MGAVRLRLGSREPGSGFIHCGWIDPHLYLSYTKTKIHHRDIPAFLQTLEAGKAMVEKVRKGLWDKRAPNSELVYPHVHIFNPEPLRRSMNRALLEQVRGWVGW